MQLYIYATIYICNYIYMQLYIYATIYICNYIYMQLSIHAVIIASCASSDDDYIAVESYLDFTEKPQLESACF